MPGNLSLVVNHREAGENYNTALGANTKLLSRAADLDKLFNFSGINPINSYAVDAESGIVVESTDFDSAWSEMISHDLELSLSTFPEIKHLSHQQYDLGLRRVGSFGADRTHNYLDKLFDCVVNAETGVLATVVRFCTGAHIPGAAMISNDIINNADAHVVNRLVTTKRSFMRYSQLLSSYHVDDIRMLRTAALSKKQWCYIMDMIESYLLPNSNILSVEISPLIDLSRLKHLGYLNTIVANSQKFCGSLVKRYNLPATDNSFESLVECTTVDEIASNGKFDMAIINLHLSQLQDIDIQKLWTKVAPINYILVLDVCSSAPTEFAVDHRRYDSEANDDENSSFEDIFDQTETSYYVSVDDLCTMGAVDSGAVLFRYKIMLEYVPLQY